MNSETSDSKRKEDLEEKLERMQRQIAQLRAEFEDFRTKSLLNATAMRNPHV